MIRALVAVAALALAGAADAGVRSGFSAHVDNPFFPLVPGRTLVYIGTVEGKRATEYVRTTHRAVMLDGAPCAVIDDRLYLNGKLAERTIDWYSQDAKGTVWYFGEQTAELDRRGRVVSTEGSWRAGRHGARPGIVMPAHPRAGQTFAQERASGVAEDHVRIVSVSEPITADKATVETREWTPLEPGVLERKTYVRNHGPDVDETVKGPEEHLETIAVRGP